MKTKIKNIIVKESATNKVKGNVKPFINEINKSKNKKGSFMQVSYKILRNTLILF